MRPPSLGLTLRADPATLAQFTRLASVLGVSRSRLATAAVVDGVEALLEQPEVQAMLSGAPPCRSARGGEARRPSGTASDEAERHQSSATSAAGGAAAAGSRAATEKPLGVRLNETKQLAPKVFTNRRLAAMFGISVGHVSNLLRKEACAHA